MAYPISPGQKVRATVTWRNDNLVSFTPTWRLDVKPDTRMTWLEGVESQGPVAAAGDTQILTVNSKAILADWVPGAGQTVKVSVKLVVIGREGDVWGWTDERGKNIFEMVGPDPTKVKIISVSADVAV